VFALGAACNSTQHRQKMPDAIMSGYGTVSRGFREDESANRRYDVIICRNPMEDLAWVSFSLRQFAGSH
jgi:hypothetical protein